MASVFDQPTDQDALRLTHAIGLQESGGISGKPNYNAVGDAGTSHGAYQWQPGNFESAAKQYGLDSKDLSPMNQDKVAYAQVKAMKDKGLDPGQIASSWNSGSPNNWKDHSGDTVINGKKIHYDTPAYVKGVQAHYQQLKGATPDNPSSTTSQTPAKEPQSQDNGFLKNVQNVLTTIFPGSQQIGESLGTAAFNVGQITQGKNPFANPEKVGWVSQPGTNPASQVNVPKTIGGYVSAGSMVAAPEFGGSTALGRIGATAGLGAIAGAGGAMAQGGGVGDTVKGGLLGGAVGGVAGGVGELLSKATKYLPQRLARTFLPGTSKETAQYAVSKGLGTPTKMLAESDSSLQKIGSGIESVLSDPSIAGVTATAQDVYPSIIEKYPNAGLTMENVGEQLKKMAPLEKGLIDKLEASGLSAKELNNLKSAIGENTYKLRFDEPTVKAGKDIGNAAYASISDWLKGVLPAVRSDMPDITPLFDEYTKELQLNGALQKAIRAGEKARPFTLRDIVAIMAGLGVGGPAGAVGTYALERGAVNPSLNLVAGGLVNKLNNPAVGALGRQGVVGLLGQNLARVSNSSQ